MPLQTIEDSRSMDINTSIQAVIAWWFFYLVTTIHVK
jgi:hypothetical protein